MAKHTARSLLKSLWQIALSDKPEEGAKTLVDEVKSEAKKEAGEYKPLNSPQVIETTAEEVKDD